MANNQRTHYSNQVISTIASILFPGLCWYFSIGLKSELWYLLWIAPAPILFFAFRNKAKASFFVSFIAYLIGRMSWFSYLVTVATIVPAVIFTLLLPLIFALIVWLTRLTVLKMNSWLSIFVFPVFFTCFEFLLIKFSPDGTAASIAYSQSDFLMLIQLVSITGILGITFTVCFVPSAIAVALFYREEKLKLRNISILSVSLLLLVLVSGFIRLSNKPGHNNTIETGLVVLEEKYHTISEHPDFNKEKTVAALYAKEIFTLAEKGAKVVVLPERALNINKESEKDIIGILRDAAKQSHVFIVSGYTNFRNDKERNSALVIDADGNVINDYNKVHLVTGLEAQFTPGKDAGLFKLNETSVGTAICKDLDFPSYISGYGAKGASVLFIPAWDFIKDDWLHSRMSVLRGVENGFSEVRAARQGSLTISDCYGRVNYEANCANGNKASLTGTVSLEKVNTIYLATGDWLGWVCLIATGFFIFFRFNQKEKSFQIK